MRRNHKVEARVWVIMGLLAAAACGDDGDDATIEQPQPDPAVEEDADVIVEDDPDASEDIDQTPPDAGTTPLDASVGNKPDATITTTPDASLGTPDASTSDNAAALRGKAIAEANTCSTCHGANYAGLGYFPNITPHATSGIGGWTDQQIGAAITDGVNEKGESLCAGMERYELTSAQVSDLVAFLRSLAPNAKVISAVCPGHGT